MIRWTQRKMREISIHAPRTGSDDVMNALKPILTKFQSTLPARGATQVLAV